MKRLKKYNLNLRYLNNSQKIIEKKKKGWIPIYEPERIQQIQNSHQRTIRGIAEKLYHEKLLKVQEEEELIKKYHNQRKMPIEHFDNIYEQQMDDYQKQIKIREEERCKREIEECTFLPTTNHNAKKLIKQKMMSINADNKSHLHNYKNSRVSNDDKNLKKKSNKSIDVVERMERFQKSKNIKIEQRKRDLTPKFTPKVLESYNSRKSIKKGNKNDFKTNKFDVTHKENVSGKKFSS
jgi:hypothetical protein